MPILSIDTRATYNNETKEIYLAADHNSIMTLSQLQSLVRQATVEHSLAPSKPFNYHLYENLYQFSRKEAINFLMVGVGDIFFEAPRELVLSLVGKYFLGDLVNRSKNAH
jgi:hypothetical protein